MILVTGATGFVGNSLLQRMLAEDDLRVVAAGVRREVKKWLQRIMPRVMGDIEPTSDWSGVLEGVSMIVHCAARVHIMADAAADPLAAFRLVNVKGTVNLARQAAAAGVRRFVFISYF